MKPRSAGITADSSETPSCASSLQEAKQITVDKQEWGVYSEQPMNPNTVQVQDCTHTLTEMYGCVYRRICLVTHPLNSARQLPAQLSVFRHRFAKLQKKGLSQTREGIRLVILDQFPWLTQTRSMLGGGNTDCLQLLAGSQETPAKVITVSCHRSSQVPVWHR